MIKDLMDVGIPCLVCNGSGAAIEQTKKDCEAGAGEGIMLSTKHYQ